LLLVFVQPQVALAQTVDPERERAFQLYEENKFTDAVPLLEKLANADPSDMVVLSRLGFALYATTVVIKDPEERKRARTRARNILERAQSLGDNSVLTKVTIDTLAANEDGEVSYSRLQAADRAMQEGEAAFVRGDFAAAIKFYDEALAADPRLYEAALYKGDVYYKSDQQDKAGEWFGNAIKIDPDRETAYRYWGDSLMKQGKLDEAREKFIEAYLAEPYSRLARNGFVQWAEQKKISLGHPRIDVPTSVAPSKDGKVTINVDPSALKDEDGSSAWLMYGLSRTSWATSEFAKQYPNEKTYRHGLKEEASAFHAVAESVRTQQREKKIKQLNASLAMLVKLDNDGLLEPYILLARPDEGIAQDYGGFRRTSLDKLRRYVLEYVLTAGNK
jgi:tetratricopeptide (TPR) repeat protein